MNLILLFPKDFVAKNLVRLDDYRAVHIREIHRAQVGKTLRVGLAGGGIGDGRVLSIQEKEVSLEVNLPEAKPNLPILSLLLALPRPQTLKKILEIIGAFGIRRLSLVGTERVQKSFFDSHLLQNEAWKKHLHLGMEQGGRTFVPEMTLHKNFQEWLTKEKDNLPPLRLIAHPGENHSLWDVAPQMGTTTQILCAVGPEGGWLEHEITTFVESGFEKIRLGDTIHRVENAVTALLSQIELMRMRTS